MISIKKNILIFLILLGSIFSLHAEVFFSGLSGAKFDFSSDPESSGFDPDLKVQSFFSGQFNLSENVITHMEFSLGTANLLEDSIFRKTPADFQVDELSLVIRAQFYSMVNYLSVFAGTYEPIGSDIFLRRQFGIQPISSRLTESWLGLAGSVIYPLFGVGGADVIHFTSAPVATGLYVYVNHELDDSYVWNADARFACVYRFFAFDMAGGIGVPLNSGDDNSDAFLVIDKIYCRGAFNMLIGNKYTKASLYLQGGTSEVPLTKKNSSFDISASKTYILIEPRFRMGLVNMNLTFFSLPEETAKSFYLIDGTFGINLDLFSNTFNYGVKTMMFGVSSQFSFDNLYFDVLKSPGDFNDDWTISISPYIQSNFGKGELHTMIQLRPTDIFNGDASSCWSLKIGYKTQF